MLNYVNKIGDVMKIAVVDADLIGRKRHRFPNLACEKISGYYKELGEEVILETDYDNLCNYDIAYVSKVFTDTPIPDWVIESDNVCFGGTGFYFDKAEPLDDVIEHHMPDYHLYDAWIENEVDNAKKEAKRIGKVFNERNYRAQFKEYTDCSIGFITRGCFRHCEFCVNKKFDNVFKHSPIEEFYDPDRKVICLLDDNFLGYSNWKEELNFLISTGKEFKFKQGLDERLLTDEKCDLLFSSKYSGDYIFAFDKINEYDLIKEKLEMIRRHTKIVNIKFYVLVGFDSQDAVDIENIFKRIALLMEYKCLPYIMRYQDKNYSPWKESDYRTMYITIARWCNQPSIFKKMSFRQFCEGNQKLHKTDETYCSAYQAMLDFENDYPEIAEKYFDLRYEDFIL